LRCTLAAYREDQETAIMVFELVIVLVVLAQASYSGASGRFGERFGGTSFSGATLPFDSTV
jgi:hypothetical protein